MPVVFSLIVATTFFLNAEQTLDAVTTAVESEIAAIDSTLRNVLESGTNLLSEVSAAVESELEAAESESAFSGDTIATNVSPADIEDQKAAVVGTEITAAELAGLETLQTDTVASEEEIEVESDVADDSESDLVVSAENTDVAVPGLVEVDIVASDVVTDFSGEADVTESAVIAAESADETAEAVEAIDEDIQPSSAVLTSAWPDLSEHTRATILMLIEADQMVRQLN